MLELCFKLISKVTTLITFVRYWSQLFVKELKSAEFLFGLHNSQIISIIYLHTNVLCYINLIIRIHMNVTKLLLTIARKIVCIISLWEILYTCTFFLRNTYSNMITYLHRTCTFCILYYINKEISGSYKRRVDNIIS